MSESSLVSLARPGVRPPPVYNAGLSSEAVRARYGVSQITLLANGPVTEALLRQGVIIKPWKEPGFEHLLRVSIGNDNDNARFVQALLTTMAHTESATA